MPKPTTLDDIAESIADLSTMTAQLIADQNAGLRTEMQSGFAALRQEIADGDAAVRKEMADGFAAVNTGFVTVHRDQRETIKRLIKLELAIGGLDEDVLELYRLVEKLRKDHSTFTAKERDRFVELEAFAMKVAEKTGIPYHPSSNPKPKRRS